MAKKSLCFEGFPPDKNEKELKVFPIPLVDCKKEDCPKCKHRVSCVFKGAFNIPGVSGVTVRRVGV